MSILSNKTGKKLAEINLIQLAILFHFLILQRLPIQPQYLAQVGTEKRLATKNRLWNYYFENEWISSMFFIKLTNLIKIQCSDLSKLLTGLMWSRHRNNNVSVNYITHKKNGLWKLGARDVKKKKKKADNSFQIPTNTTWATLSNSSGLFFNFSSLSSSSRRYSLILSFSLFLKSNKRYGIFKRNKNLHT